MTFVKWIDPDQRCQGKCKDGSQCLNHGVIKGYCRHHANVRGKK